MPSRNKTYSFLAMWDMNGLEVIYDTKSARAKIKAWEKLKVVARLYE